MSKNGYIKGRICQRTVIPKDEILRPQKSQHEKIVIIRFYTNPAQLSNQLLIPSVNSFPS